MKQALELLKRKRKIQEALAKWLLDQMQELTKKQADIVTSLLWSEFIEKLNDLNTHYRRALSAQTTLDCVILELENEVKDNE